MMAQKCPIRTSRPRIIIYNFHENIFKKPDMLADSADGVDVIEDEIIGLRDCCGVDFLRDVGERRGEVCIVGRGEGG